MTLANFTGLQPWAVLPEKPDVPFQAMRAERDLYAQHFRHLRIARLESDCPPWRMGQELGWIVRSPVTVAMDRLDDLDLGLQDGEDIGTIGRRYGRTEAWDRDGSWIAASGAAWMRLYDHQTERGWEAMFLPNGRGSLEWKLGWGIAFNDPYFLMMLPVGNTGLDVPLGVISAKMAKGMTEQGGFSLACRPTRPTTIQRGDPIARIVLLHADSLRAQTVYGEEANVSVRDD